MIIELLKVRLDSKVYIKIHIRLHGTPRVVFV